MSGVGGKSTRRFVLQGFVCLLWVGLLGVDRPKGLGDVEEIRTWSYPDYTRVVVELSRPVVLSEDPVVRLGRDDKVKRPERLYIDIPGIWVGREYKEGVPVGDGLLQAVRMGQNTLETTRLVIDLERYDRHRMFSLSLLSDLSPGQHALPKSSNRY